MCGSLGLYSRHIMGELGLSVISGVFGLSVKIKVRLLQQLIASVSYPFPIWTSQTKLLLVVFEILSTSMQPPVCELHLDTTKCEWQIVWCRWGLCLFRDETLRAVPSLSFTEVCSLFWLTVARLLTRGLPVWSILGIYRRHCFASGNAPFSS